MRTSIRADVAIVGGGIAGLWLLNVLTSREMDVVLLERSAFGDGQTIASQGMIHGGIKYSLSGALTRASEAIAGMPQRWRRCLAGAGEIDLTAVRTLSNRYYMWAANDSIRGQLGSLLAAKMLRSRVRRLDPAEYPRPFDDRAFVGVVYELDELVLDTASLLRALADKHRGRVVEADVRAEHIVSDRAGNVAALSLDGVDLVAGSYVFAAGAGNEPLLQAIDGAPAMQRRSLKQVVLTSSLDVPIYAHCIADLARAEPRITITTHPRAGGGAFYYLGGQLATDGVARSDAEQIRFARSELARLLPWLAFGDAELATVTIDRAEPATAGTSRPDEAFVWRTGNALVCWPTKLTLAPDLGDKVLAELAEQKRGQRHFSAEQKRGQRHFSARKTASDPVFPFAAHRLDVARPPWEAT